jgi:hypothetical protein
MSLVNPDAPIPVKVVALHRQKAIDLGFTHEDFSAWIDILSTWLFSCGAVEVSFGGRDENKDEIEVEGHFKDEHERSSGRAPTRGRTGSG